MTNSNNTPKTYPCPHCKEATTWQDNKFKPFCSKRCKLIDLGSWANEDYKLADNQSDVFSSDMY